METMFSSVIRKLQEIEDRYGIIIKIELFTAVEGTVYYITDTREIVWRVGYEFAGLEEWNKGLVEFEEFLAG
jgi:hypothetical protein